MNTRHSRGFLVAIVAVLGLAPGSALAQGTYGAGAAATAGAYGGAAVTNTGGAIGNAMNTVTSPVTGALGTVGGWGTPYVDSWSGRDASLRAYDSPDLDLYFGAAIPLNHMSDYVDTGGVVGLFAGYRWGLAEHFALGIVANPQFTIASTDYTGNCYLYGCSGKTVSSTFSIGLGPKFSFVEGPTQISLAVTGAYFRDISGVLDSSGAGVAGHLAVTRDIWEGFNAGIFARIEEQLLSPYPPGPRGNNAYGYRDNHVDDRQVVMAGVQLGWGMAPVVAAATLPPPPAVEAPVRKKIVLRGVNFDYDKSTLQAAGRPILDEAAEILKSNPDVTVEVRGYTDSRGSDGYNMRLSERRAQTVKNYLVSRGVPASRLVTRGYGESDPVATNETAAGRAQNRRVELVPIQ